MGLLYYEQINLSFPPALETDPGDNPATTIHFRTNWALHALYFTDAQPLVEMFDPATYVSDNGPSNGNSVVRATLVPAMLCPTDNSANRTPYAGDGGGWARGIMPSMPAAHMGFGGTANSATDPAGLWDAKDRACTGWADPRARGVLGPNSCVMPLVGVTDGLATTFLVGEIRAGVSSMDRRGTWAMGAAGASVVCYYGWGGKDNGPNCCTGDADSIVGAAGFDNALDANDCMKPMGSVAMTELRQVVKVWP